MLQATVASSTQADATLAAREMAKTLKEENLKAAFVYCSCELVSPALSHRKATSEETSPLREPWGFRIRISP